MPQDRENDAQCREELRVTEAMLCAVLTKFKSMHNDGQFYDFMETAAGPGIVEWWEAHKEIDRGRLAEATSRFLGNFSEQEQEAIITLFKED